MISIEEFCRFSLNGRLRLLGHYGELVFEKMTIDKAMAVFRQGDFHVVVTRNIKESRIVSVEPVLQEDVLLLYMTL